MFIGQWQSLDVNLRERRAVTTSAILRRLQLVECVRRLAHQVRPVSLDPLEDLGIGQEVALLQMFTVLGARRFDFRAAPLCRLPLPSHLLFRDLS